MKAFLASVAQQVKDKFIDLMALVVAIAAVCISWKQSETQSLLTIADWRPLLTMELIKADAEPKKGFLIRNVGLGPAIIESFRYYKNDSAYQQGLYFEEWLDTAGFTKAIPLEFIFEDINMLTPGSIISSEDKEDLFLLGTRTPQFYNSPTAKAMEKVIIEIAYKSISTLDKQRYYLRFCENFIKNNITDSTEPHTWEKTMRL